MYRINNPKNKFIFIKSKGKEKMESSPLKEIASELPFFKTVDEREKLLGVVGALVLRQVSSAKLQKSWEWEKKPFLNCWMP